MAGCEPVGQAKASLGRLTTVAWSAGAERRGLARQVGAGVLLAISAAHLATALICSSMAFCFWMTGGGLAVLDASAKGARGRREQG